MTDHTIKLIYRIKNAGKIWDHAIRDFLHEETLTPLEYISETDIYNALKTAFLDYLSTCDSPKDEVQTLLDLIETDGISSMAKNIAYTLGITEVKDDKLRYINGFRNIDISKGE